MKSVRWPLWIAGAIFVLILGCGGGGGNTGGSGSGGSASGGSSASGGGSAGSTAGASAVRDAVSKALSDKFVQLAARSHAENRAALIAYAKSLPDIRDAGWSD